MVWGGSFNVNTVISQIPNSSKYLLGFNEPNLFSQSNLSPAQAAALWPKIQQIASAKNLKIVSPAVNYCGPPSACWTTDPISYLQQFFGNCTGCKVDYVAAHFYPGSCTQPYFDTLLAQLTQFNRPIWLTEFSCSGATNYSVQNAYMQMALSDLENNVNVFRYAWFSGRDTNVPFSSTLNTSPGQLTVLGTTYTTYLVGQQQCPSNATNASISGATTAATWTQATSPGAKKRGSVITGIVQEWILSKISNVNGTTLSIEVIPIANGFEVLVNVSGSNSLSVANTIADSLRTPTERAALEAETNSTVILSSIQVFQINDSLQNSDITENLQYSLVVAISVCVAAALVVVAIISIVVVLLINKQRNKNERV